jgi:hypothetical protein
MSFVHLLIRVAILLEGLKVGKTVCTFVLIRNSLHDDDDDDDDAAAAAMMS